MELTTENVKGEKTKYRLAQSMKECMKTTTVDNITVKQITENCGLTRQTFYRNFMDKFDLINWYFDKLLAKSFEHMGMGKTVYDALVKKFTYIQEEHIFFAAALYSGNVLPEFYLYDCKMGAGGIGVCTGGTGKNFS